MATTRLVLAVTAFVVLASTATIGIAAPTQLALSGDATTANPGEEATVSLSLTNTGETSVTGPAVKITDYPENWTLTNHQNDDGIYKDNPVTWIWLSLGANTTVTPSATFDVPDSTAPGTYTVEAAVILDGTTVDNVSIPVTVESPLTVATQNVTASSGDTVTLPFELNNTGTTSITGPALRISSLPANWTVSTHSDVGGTWKADELTWVWLKIDGNSSISPSISVNIPDDTTAGTYNVTVTAIQDGSNVSTDTATVRVKTSVERTYDRDNSGAIETTEVQQAISDWTTTDLSLVDLQRLIKIWATS